MTNSDAEKMKKILTDAKRIAVVGATSDPSRPSNTIPAYMQEQGYEIIPVNPRGGEMLGSEAVAALADVQGSIDIVNVFRRSEQTPEVAREAVAAGAKVLWLQLGIASDEARQIAEDGGLEVVMDACIGVEHGRLGLGPGPH